MFHCQRKSSSFKIGEAKQTLEDRIKRLKVGIFVFNRVASQKKKTKKGKGKKKKEERICNELVELRQINQIVT